MILVLLALAFWLAVAVAGASVLAWPLAISAVIIGIAVGVAWVRRPSPPAREPAPAEPAGPGEPYRPRTRDPEYRPRG